MSYFTRWWTQPVISKINSKLANKIYDERIAAAFPLGHKFNGIEFIQLETLPFEVGVFKKLTDDADDIFPDFVEEIYHCNIKFPISRIKEIWGIDKFGSGDYVSAVTEDTGGFLNILRNKIMEDFVSFEESKISKVGRFLKNDKTLRLYLDDKKLPIDRNAGVALFETIKRNSDIFLSGKYHIETGAESAGSLITFQAILFLPISITKKKKIEVTEQIYASTENYVGSEGATSDDQTNLVGVNTYGLNFIREVACEPVPKKERRPRADDPEAETSQKKLTPREVKERKLSKKQKEDIAKKVQAKLLQVSDSAFFNALLNADKIRTTRDAMDFVFNVLPLQEIINLAIECLKKYIPETPESVVCNMIMRNLSDEDLKKILRYMNTNLDTNVVASAFKTEIINKFNGAVEDDPVGFKAFLISEFNNNIGTKEIICAMVFLAIPAALVLLGIYTQEAFGSRLSVAGVCVEPLTPPAIETRKLLENPVRNALSEIEAGLKSHPILSFTKNFSDNLLRQVIGFVDSIIVQSVATMLQELAYLCDGTSASDFANAPSQEPPFNSNINDLLVDKDDDAVYDDLFNFIFDENPGAGVDKPLIKDFFLDLADLLTLSEICTLMSGDPNDIRYNLIIDKIFYGLLSLDKYAPIKQVLNTRQKLINFINVFADRFDQVACNDRIEELTKKKKLLSELCSSTDDAYINDLKNKAAQSAIDELLNQENGALNDLLDAIKNLAAPQTPEIFCGPSATFKGAEPLLKSFQDPSLIHLSKKHLASIMRLAERTFETEVRTFQTSLTKSLTDLPVIVSTVSKIIEAGTDVSQALAKVYGFDPKDENGKPFFNDPEEEPIKKKLEETTAGNKLIAQRVNNILIGIESGGNLEVSLVESDANTGLVIKISTAWEPGNRQLRYFAHYPPLSELQSTDPEDYIIPGFGVNEDEAILPAGVTKLIYSSGDDPIISVYSGLLSSNATGLPLDGSGIFDDIFGANRERHSPYKAAIIETVELTPKFFGEILERIIVEHAEFITTNDLFKKQTFDKINFNKSNNCDPSLLYLSDIVGKMESRIKGIECKVGYGSVPSPAEIVQIVSLYEATVRVVTLTEMMKMLFVFVSFGIETLLPELNDDSPGAYSFYFNYLVEKIQQRMDELVPAEFSQSLDRAVSLVGSFDLNMGSEEAEQIKILQLFTFSSIKVVQAGILNRLKNSGVKTKIDDSSDNTPQLIGNSGVDEETGVFLDNMYNDPSSTVIYEQIIRNVIPAEKELSILSPPEVVMVDIDNREVIIPAGFYSNNPRLKNGGFFIEQGLEILNHRVLDPSQYGVNALTPQDLITMISMVPLEPGPNEMVNFKANNNAWLLDLNLYKSKNLAPKDISSGIFDGEYWKKLEYAKNIVNLLGYAKNFPMSVEPNLVVDQLISGLNLFKDGPEFPDQPPFGPANNVVNAQVISFDENGDVIASVDPEYVKFKQYEQFNFFYLIQKYLFGAEEFGSERKVLSSMFNAVAPGQQLNNIQDLGAGPLSTLSLLSQKQGRLGFQDPQVQNELLHTFEVARYFTDIYVAAVKVAFENGTAQEVNPLVIGIDPDVAAEIILNRKKDINSKIKKVLTINVESQTGPKSLKPGENPFYDTEAEGIEYWMDLGFTEDVAENIVAGGYVPPGYEEYAEGPGGSAGGTIKPGQFGGDAADLSFNNLIPLLRQRLNKLDSYFYKFGKYMTFNLLIRLDEEDDIVNSLKSTLKQISINADLIAPEAGFSESTKNNQSYTASVLERKYFLREESGELYFKLPLVYKYANIENSEQYENEILNIEENSSIFDLDTELLVASFSNLFESIPYKDLLSFVSILVTETLSGEYPSLNDMFSNTIRTLGTGTKQSLQASDRVNNPNLYESDIDAAAYNDPGTANPDLLSSFLGGIFKGVANMTDPTWRTPWLLPGPITPFGVLAKLLEGEDDIEDPEDAAKKIKDETDISKSYDCPDDKTNSDN